MFTLLPAFLPLVLPTGGHADLHPQTAVAFVEIPELVALDESYPGTSLMRLLADEDVKKTLAGFLGEDFDPLVELREVVGSELLGADGAKTDELYHALAGISISVSTASGALEDSMDAYAFQASLEMREGVDAAGIHQVLLQALSRQNPEAIQEEEVELEGGGVQKITRIDGAIPGYGSAWVVTSGSRLLVGAGTLDPGSAIQRLSGGGSSSLAQNAQYVASTKALSATENPTVFGAYSLPGDGLRELLDVPDLGPAIAILEGLFGTNVSMLSGGGRWRTTLKEGRFVTHGYQPQRASSSPLAGLLGTKPVDPAAASFISPDAVLAWLVHFDRDKLVAHLPTILDDGREGRGEAMLAELEEGYGLRIERDLIAPLGSNLSFSLPPLRSIMSAPDLRLAVSLSDRERFLTGMNGLFKLLASEQFAGDFSVKETAYRKVPLFTLTFVPSGQPTGLPIDPASLVRPTLAVLEDRVLVGLLPTYVKRDIRRIFDEAKAAESGEEIPTHAHVSAASVPKGAHEIAFADWGALIGGLYSGIRAIAPMIGGMIDLPIDLATLPEAEIFTRFFEPSFRSKIAGEHGGVLHYAESSFGPEMPVSIAAGIAGALMPSARPTHIGHDGLEIVTVDASSEAEEDPRGITVGTLKALRVGLTVYQLEHKAFPENLASLLEPTTNYPSGFLDTEEVPNDGWDHAFVYARTEAGYSLWSKGEDGVDQGGEGDDVPLP